MRDFKFQIKSESHKGTSFSKYVGTYHLLSRIGDLSKFYWYLTKRFSSVEYEPELFPCITLLYTIVKIQLFVYFTRVKLICLEYDK